VEQIDEMQHDLVKVKARLDVLERPKIARIINPGRVRWEQNVDATERGGA
jgi:hypothetical protein